MNGRRSISLLMLRVSRKQRAEYGIDCDVFMNGMAIETKKCFHFHRHTAIMSVHGVTMSPNRIAAGRELSTSSVTSVQINSFNFTPNISA